MTKENLHSDLKDATLKLLEMARDHSWNTVSDNCLYIISEINDLVGKNIFEQKKIRKKVNQRKKPIPIEIVVSELELIYGNLYDVNLFIYKSTSKLTVVEIQFYPKTSLVKDNLEKAKDIDPMLHCKVAIPPYSKDDKSKFDINWELGGFRHNWKMYWGRKRMKNSKTGTEVI